MNAPDPKAISFRLSLDALKAMLRLASTDETRYALCGVNVDWSDGRLRLVATDGRRLGVLLPYDIVIDGQPSVPVMNFTIPSALIAAIPPTPLDVEVRCTNNKITICSSVEGVALETTAHAIALPYPHWRPVLPTGEERCDLGEMLVSLGYFAAFASVLAGIGADGTAVALTTIKDGPFVIRSLSRSHEFLGLLLPLREGANRPADFRWLGKPESEAGA